MKRIMSACLLQESRFDSKPDFDDYVAKLERKKTKHIIESSTENADGTVTAIIKLQYLNYSSGQFMEQ